MIAPLVADPPKLELESGVACFICSFVEMVSPKKEQGKKRRCNYTTLSQITHNLSSLEALLSLSLSFKARSPWQSEMA